MPPLTKSLLRDEIFPGIAARGIKGFRGISLLRREEGGESEFMTVMRFDGLKDVRDFAGQNYEAAVIPPRARALLARCDERALHYTGGGRLADVSGGMDLSADPTGRRRRPCGRAGG